MHRGFQDPAAPPRRLTAPRIRVSLTAENQSLINSFRSAALTPQETDETCLQSLFNLMTTSEEEGEAQFLEVISALEENHLPSMASLLTSNSDRFLEIARNKNGSYRLQDLIGKSADADISFFDAILGRLVDFLTEQNASHVAIHGMRVVNEVKRKAMYPQIVFHAVGLACHRDGNIVLRRIITNLYDPYYRVKLLDKVASNALYLSYDVFGSFVVQHVIKLNDLRSTLEVASRLEGHCVKLSFTKYGSYVVERLLKTVESRHMVVAELLGCQKDRFEMLATSKCGSYVVGEALRVTQYESMNRPHLFWGLVNKLTPIYSRLHRSPGRTIAEFLDWIYYYNSFVSN